jgi:hypothetical protein
MSASITKNTAALLGQCLLAGAALGITTQGACIGYLALKQKYQQNNERQQSVPLTQLPNDTFYKNP